MSSRTMSFLYGVIAGGATYYIVDVGLMRDISSARAKAGQVREELVGVSSYGPTAAKYAATQITALKSQAGDKLKSGVQEAMGEGFKGVSAGIQTATSGLQSFVTGLSSSEKKN